MEEMEKERQTAADTLRKQSDADDELITDSKCCTDS